MRTRTLTLLLAAALVASAAADDDTLSATEKLAIIDAVQPALVHVEYHLQYDKGEAPTAAGWVERCPNCGRYHGGYSGEDLVKEERPREIGGFLLSPTLVLTLDPQIHPRFVKRVAVKAGEQLVDAEPAAYMRNQNAVLLKLAAPLADARPLEFKPDADGPYYAVSYQQANAAWVTYVKPLATDVSTTDTGLHLRNVPGACLLVDKQGVPVGMSINAELPLDDSWKGSPRDWPAISAEEMAALLAKLEKVARDGLLHVTLKLRSPKKDRGSPWRSRWGEDQEGATEMQAVGILLDEKRLLILAHLKPNTTARLEQIQVRLADGKKETARFAHSLRDFGCFIAELEQPRDGAVAIDSGDVRRFRSELILAAQILLYGESRTMRFMHARIPAFDVGRKRNVYPELHQDAGNLYLFRADGTLIAAPVIVREKTEGEYRWSSNDPVTTPIAYVTELLADLAQSTDPSNVPLTEAAENRIAWMGLELQNLDQDLARINKVSELTRDGETGALVSYVYSDSPADRAGVKPGAILLRLYVEDHPKPIEVRTDDEQMSGFPWDRLDEVPEQYFDQIPTPWPSAENRFNRTLTDLGFGKRYKAEFSCDGQIVTEDFEVVESPPHYDSAQRLKIESLGLTARELTFEVRRYFQIKADDPGVIISKVEQGSKASVAGLKPFEIVTHVGDQPVHAVGDFEKLIAQADRELRLNVKRMTRGRIVKIKMQPATKDEEAGEGEQNPPEGA